MRVVFTRHTIGNYGPYFGFATKVREYDKLFHFAVSAAGVALAALFFGLFFWSIPAMALSTLAALACGIGVAINHGFEAGDEPGEIRIGRNTILNLAADLAGVALAWLFFWRL